ncbi:uncharacterized protein LOC132295392 [Cornus florida]|uniref:uncharacterized protein LOC132295392 n=1 Tax=Cornus florida TaxID=4283 RepID=UPI002898E595|nr:uncharacterized protein LOC132295392 [Cornus florida]XP_059649656.1 uncharacterized protein LOC132295392 [Cornus florida]
MEEGSGSGDPSGYLVKKKSSSGCLIIKKKGDGMSGVGSSGSRKVVGSKKEKKRPRLLLSDSGSSDELLEPLRRKIVSKNNKFHNGSLVYNKCIVDDREIRRNGKIESERKRSRLDVFEFDEYDAMDGKIMRNDFMDDRLKLAGRSGNQREFEGGSNRHVMVDKRKHSYVDGTSSSLGGRNRGPNFTLKNRFEMEEDDEAHMPISFLREKVREPSDELIRLQGKNGVLKVMVNKKKLGLSRRTCDQQESEDRKDSRSEDAIKKNMPVRPSFYSDSKRREKRDSFVRAEKSELKTKKSISSKSSMTGELEKEDSNTLLNPGSTSMQACSSSKRVKNEGSVTPSAEQITPTRGKEGKVKRGTGTEKQLLREKIRNMLVNAGWTIDYRPRRNRDYLDAVYINPAGTAYWSIIKAYDALQKQLEEDNIKIEPSRVSSPFTPLSEEILSKLTRQTRKKMEKEMKKKRRDVDRSKNVKDSVSEESEDDMDSDEHEKKLSSFKKHSGKSVKGRLREAKNDSGDDSSGNLYKGTPKQAKAEKLSTTTNSQMIQGTKSRKFGRCTLLVRGSDKGPNSEKDDFAPYTGKRTLLSWLIDSGTVHLSEKVQYMNRRRTRVMLEGWITRDGIHCGCCSKILTVLKFEIHAGSKLRQPFQNIYLESGVSLLQCQIDAWNRQKESERCGFQTVDVDGDDPNDDTCGLCGDGGDLICCDGCPSTFHQSCLDIQMLPAGDWHCPNCTCKLCGIAEGCVAEENDTASSEVLTCSLCEKKYHESCSQEMDALPANSDNAYPSFCGRKCQELFDHLQKLLGVKNELEAGFSWSLIHRMDPDRGFPQRVECNSKLAVALSVMDECFLPIVDRRSGINLIHNVLYNCGSNFSRLNYSGFYTAILERGDEIISAASIRIRGTQLAEMPFIGTRHIYRRQGMMRRLLCAIESALCSLKVEKLIIPAIAEHMHTWTVVFGFNPLEESHKQEMRTMNMLVFPGTDMLQKLLVEQEITEGNTLSNSGGKSTKIKDNDCIVPDLAKESDMDSSAGNDLHMCDDGVHHSNDLNDKGSSTDSSSQDPDLPRNDTAGLSSSLDAPEPNLQVSSEEAISFNSQLVDKLTESTADLKCLSSDVSHAILEMKNPVLGRLDKDNVQSSAEGAVDDACRENVQVACGEPVPDSLDETSANNIAEDVNKNHNLVSVSGVYVTDGSTIQDTTMQFNSNLNHQSAVDMESKLCVASEVVSGTEVAPVEGNIQSSSEGSDSDAHKVNVKVACAGPVVLGSLGEISAQNTTENLYGSEHPVSFSTPPDVNDLTVQFNSDLNNPSALEMETRLQVVSEVPNAEVASSAKVGLAESSIQTAAVDSVGDISAKDVNEEMNESQSPDSLSRPCNSNEHAMRLNSDLNKQKSTKVESELHLAEVGSDEVAPLESNIQSNTEGHLGDAPEEEVKVACVEPILDSVFETSAQNMTQMGSESHINTEIVSDCNAVWKT